MPANPTTIEVSDMISKKHLGLILATFAFVLIPCMSQSATVVYNRYNIHIYQSRGDWHASYANYTDPGSSHQIVPPNTPMTIDTWRNGFVIMTQAAPKRKIYFAYDDRRMNMSVATYIQTITSPKIISLEHLTPKDLEGVKDGKAMPGMTKQGVLAALGYPASHRTPSLQSNEWIYWRNRFRTLAVDFDVDGIVTQVRY